MADVPATLLPPSPSNPTPTASRETAVPSLRQPGVLVVDDDPTLRAILKATLGGCGFAVWLAASGHEAVRLYEQQRSEINLVLLDVRMPLMDGPRTLEALQRLDPGVVCCFMSGHCGEYSLADLLGRGAVHFFEKPFRMEEIIRVLGALATSQCARVAARA